MTLKINGYGTKLITLWALTICALAIPPASYADELSLDNKNVPIAKHIKKNSSIKFLEKRPSEFNRLGFSDKQSSKIAMEYNGPTSRLPRGAGTNDIKPNCEKDAVRRVPVVYDSEELKFFDILYYNYQNTTQSREAELWERPAAPYLEGDLDNPYRDPKNMQQQLARFFKIQCLPTRVHFVTVDGVKYKEYREGARAWDRDSP